MTQIGEQHAVAQVEQARPVRGGFPTDQGASRLRLDGRVDDARQRRAPALRFGRARELPIDVEKALEMGSPGRSLLLFAQQAVPQPHRCRRRVRPCEAALDRALRRIRRLALANDPVQGQQCLVAGRRAVDHDLGVARPAPVAAPPLIPGRLRRQRGGVEHGIGEAPMVGQDGDQGLVDDADSIDPGVRLR
ncbi:MAG TPA: hypothetical protein VE993_06065 [Stellaceae bacterium]|nr:hypothetical protein [Stellaceae bacterium]